MIKYIFIALLILPLTACNEENTATDKLTIVSLYGPEHSFDVEVATTPEQLAQGLMNRTELAENAGMLFYFGGKEAERGFWMKNTLIPLDLIFIRADGRIHHIHENAIPHDVTSLSSQGLVAAVLEINGGLSKKLELYPDDKVIHPFFTQNKAQ